MAVTAATLDKELRRTLLPVVRDADFDVAATGTSYRWSTDVVWYFAVRRVTPSFCAATGWPPQSFSALVGAWYSFLVADSGRMPRDGKGRLKPKPGQHHDALGLRIGYDQRANTEALLSAAERGREDLWWIDPSGDNVEHAVADLVLQFRVAGRAFVAESGDLVRAYRKNRDFLPPETNAVAAYIRGASPSGALWWLERNQRFAERVGVDADAAAYRDLIGRLRADPGRL